MEFVARKHLAIASIRLPHVIAIVLAAALTYGLFGEQKNLAYLFNSDTFLPASFTWDLLHLPGAWRYHQIAHNPSLVPDMPLYGAIFVAIGSVPVTQILYAFLQVLGLAYAGGWIAARAAGTSVAAGAALVMALLLLQGVVAVEESAQPFILIGAPVYHVGPFAVALVGVGCAMVLVERYSRWHAFVLAGAGALAFLSDLLLMASFVGPVTAAALLLRATGRIGTRASAHVIVPLWLGVAVGWSCLVLLHRTGLLTQPVPAIEVASFAGAARAALAGLPIYAARHPVHVALTCVLMLAALVLPLLGRSTRRATGVFVWLVAILSAGAIMAFTACFYADLESFRFTTPIFIWSAVIVASVALRWSWYPLGFCVAACLAALAWQSGRLRDPASILAFDTDVARCVRTWREPLGLRAGLATYWYARASTAALGWTTQIDQITSDAQVYPWGIDVSWYVRDITDPQRPPEYNFVVMTGVDADAAARRLGQPSEVRSCGDVTLWIYRDGNLRRRLLAGTGLEEAIGLDR